MLWAAILTKTYWWKKRSQTIAKNGHASTEETPQILKEDGGEEGRERRKENTKVSTGGENPYGRVTDLLTKTIYDFLFFFITLLKVLKNQDHPSPITLVDQKEWDLSKWVNATQ